jgi:hypothetical protein
LATQTTVRYLQIELPPISDSQHVTQALAIDSKTGTDFWRKAIKKEMLNVTPAFGEWDGTLDEARGGKKLVGYQEIKCHMIFDIKMDFTGKARLLLAVIRPRLR